MTFMAWWRADTSSSESSGWPQRSEPARMYESPRSASSLPPRPWVRLEPVLGQLAARYHYLLDSGQSNLSACSCFIELDKYNM